MRDESDRVIEGLRREREHFLPRHEQFKAEMRKLGLSAALEFEIVRIAEDCYGPDMERYVRRMRGADGRN